MRSGRIQNYRGDLVSLPRVTAVVLNWCGEVVTTDCLHSLLASDYKALNPLLVDNGSPEDSVKRLRASFPTIDFLQNSRNLGYAGGNNRGIEQALEDDADYVLILNNDTVVEPDAVSKLVETAETADGKVGGVVPKILYYDEPDRIWYGGGEFSSSHGLGIHWREGDIDRPEVREEILEVTFMTGACLLLSSKALHELNGFDEDYFAYVEDAELSLRMLQAGYGMHYQPGARVLHKCPLPGVPPSPFQIRQRDRNRRRIMRTHATLKERILFLARFYLTRAILFGRYMLTGQWQRARAILQGISGS